MESSTAMDRLATAGEVRLDELPVEFRPVPALLKYYALSSLAAGPVFFIPLMPLFFRYRTLRYRIDDEGISMRWGALFRREVSLNYARIQDIHLSSNVVERWLGLGKIQVQTASGSAKAEMTVEGVPELERMRDFLYSRMRGARDEAGGAGEAVPAEPAAGADAPVHAASRAEADELTVTLRAVTEEIRALRRVLAAREGGPSRGGPEDRPRPPGGSAAPDAPAEDPASDERSSGQASDA